MRRYQYAANESLPRYVPAKNIAEVMDRYNFYEIGDSHSSEYEIMMQFHRSLMKRNNLKWGKNIMSINENTMYPTLISNWATWTDIDKRFMLWAYQIGEPTALSWWHLPVQLEESNE